MQESLARQKTYLKQYHPFLKDTNIPNTLKNRFYSKVLLPNENGCMIYTGFVNKTGYGRIWSDKKRILIHRFSYMNFIGNIPNGMLICHSCDNPSCVAPDHLWLGTAMDNNKDRDRKNRGNSPRGERQHCAKLTVNEVHEIRKLLAKKEISQAAIARKFGMHPNAVYKIKYKMTWAFVPENDDE